MPRIQTSDLDQVLDATRPVWDRYRGSRILLTGGTGFLGSWLLEVLLHAADRCGLGLGVSVLSRDPADFERRLPHLARHPAVALLRGDVRTLELPGESFTHVLHAASPVDPRQAREEPERVLDVIVGGTRRTLAVAQACGSRRFLLVSSGAVYGRQPPDLARVSEEHPGVPDPGAPGAAYAEGKRAAEGLCALADREHGLEAVIARCFAFSGPYLPLDGRFAIGNFVRDALSDGPIHVAGDGSPVRSYLYGADLAAWLWTMLEKGQGGRAYNVGSERPVSIAELAGTVARVLGVSRGVEVAGSPAPGRPPERYVPSTRRAREELGLAETFDLEGSILRMAAFSRAQRA